MNIICFGQMNWDFCWTGKQHLMVRLARRGHRILYIDPQWEAPNREFNTWQRIARPSTAIRTIEPRMYVYTQQISPFLPWRFQQQRYPFLLKKLSRRLGFENPVVFSILPDTYALFRHIPRSALVYYTVDEMTGFGNMSQDEKRSIRRKEEELVRRSQVAIVVSQRLQDRLQKLQPRTYLLPNAVDLDHFGEKRLEEIAPHPFMEGIEPPCLGFIGQIDERMDQGLLQYVARHHPEWTIVLVGRVKNGVNVSILENEPNIHLAGYHAYETLPSFAKAFDVCLIPYRVNAFTRSCCPLKAYEYLATGRPVVSTPLDGLPPHQTAIATASGYDAFVLSVEQALTADTAEKKSARLALAEESSWDRRADDLENYIHEAVGVAEGRTRISISVPSLR